MHGACTPRWSSPRIGWAGLTQPTPVGKLIEGLTQKDFTNLEDGKPDYYLANDGDVICVANFESALLDLPFNSSKADAERSFIAFTERIPPKDTKVTLLLEPVLPKKDAKSTEKK